MSLEIDFVTHGDASDRLGVAKPTLRHWADKLEDFDTHYVQRNNRNERIYNEADLEIFAFLRDLKAEHGRKTTTRDLANIITEKGRRGEFTLRTRDEVPQLEPSNRTADLLNQEDIQRLMASNRVRQFMSIIADEVKEELTAEIEEANKKVLESQKRMEEAQKKQDEEWDKRWEEHDKRLNDYIHETRELKKLLEEANKPFWKKWFK